MTTIANELFYVDPIDSAFPGALNTIPNTQPLLINAVIPDAGGFSAGVGNIASPPPFEVNVYIKQAATPIALSNGNNTITLACAGPGTSGLLNTYAVTCANSSGYTLMFTVIPTLISVLGASVVGNQTVSPQTISSGGTGVFYLTKPTASTEAMAVQIQLATPLKPIFQ